jgi:ribosomal protein S11
LSFNQNVCSFAADSTLLEIANQQGKKILLRSSGTSARARARASTSASAISISVGIARNVDDWEFGDP